MLYLVDYDLYSDTFYYHYSRNLEFHITFTCLRMATGNVNYFKPETPGVTAHACKIVNATFIIH